MHITMGGEICLPHSSACVFERNPGVMSRPETIVLIKLTEGLPNSSGIVQSMHWLLFCQIDPPTPAHTLCVNIVFDILSSGSANFLRPRVTTDFGEAPATIENSTFMSVTTFGMSFCRFNSNDVVRLVFLLAQLGIKGMVSPADRRLAAAWSRPMI